MKKKIQNRYICVISFVVIMILCYIIFYSSNTILEVDEGSISNPNTIYVCPKFQQKGVLAMEHYDGDIENRIQNIRNSKKNLYSVLDSFANYMEREKRVVYQDVELPSLTMNGSSVIQLYVGDEYIENGYSAFDNCDQELTSNVKTMGKVNTQKAGTYHLTYQVQDQAENKTELSRTVIVTEKKKNGVIYLTFDDGPRMGTTDVILDILKEEGVKATFFVTNSGPDHLILREYTEGHTVALHSASHDYSYVYQSADHYFEDLKSVHDRVYNLTGYDSRIIRFPGGSSNTISKNYSPGIMSQLTTEVLQRGYQYYDWNINSGDAGITTDPAIEYQRIVSSLSKDKENMILMHDVKTHTRDVLRQVITYGKQNGYEFDKITEKTAMLSHKVNN